MNKIGEIKPKGVPKMTVYYDPKAKANPYRVYKEWMGYTEHGCRERKQLVDKYADLETAMWELLHYCRWHNETSR